MIVNKDTQTSTMNQASVSGGKGIVGSAAGSMRKGGRIGKTGVYKLHKGEEVIPAGRKSRKTSRKSARR